MTTSESRLRIEKVLSLRTDSAAMIESLDAISSFYHENTVEARRCLRQDLEFQNIQLAKRFLAEYDEIRSRVDNVEELSGTLLQACDSVAARVSEADENMKLFMEKASELQEKSNHLSEQSKDISNFLGKYQLSPEEMEILENVSLDDNDGAQEFFGALNRLKEAYEECKGMLEKHHYSAGFELLDALGQHQERAYQRLFEWVKRGCSASAEMSADDVDVKLQVAVKCLQRLPMYFSQCEDLIVNNRRTQLVQKFVYALTQGGSSGEVFRAIDLLAHDPVRYVSDMLAWMHQTVASEVEFLEAVFGRLSALPEQSAGRDLEATKGVGEREEKEGDRGGGHGNEALLARCVQGLGRPFRVRVMQTLEANCSVEILYALADLLAFYEGTFRRLIKGENAIHSTTKGCLMECRRLFGVILKRQSDSLQSSPSHLPIDLSATHVCMTCTKQVREVVKVSKTTLSQCCYDPKDTLHLNVVLGHLIQPVLANCRSAASGLDKADLAVLMLNNISALTTALLEIGYSYSDIPAVPQAPPAPSADEIPREAPPHLEEDWLAALSAEASKWVASLEQEEAHKALARSGMDKLVESMRALPVGIVASQQTGLGKDKVSTVLRAFYASLFSTVTPQFDKIKDSSLREQAKLRTAQAITQAHAVAHAVVSLPANGYDSAILTHSAEEVAVLLGVQ